MTMTAQKLTVTPSNPMTGKALLTPLSSEGVWMRPRRGAMPVLLERDANLFSELTEPWAKEGCTPVTQIHMDVSSRCNLKCPLCYYPKGDRKKEISVERCEQIAKSHRGCLFLLAGREPTLREDLTDIIRAIKPYGPVMLLTHGLNLAKNRCLDNLLAAGLDGVILSFNGVTDKPYEVLNGRKCLKEKWEAFELLKKRRVPTVISMTVTPGVNDDQIGDVLRLCQLNTDFIKELRIRAARTLGRSNDLKGDQLFLSDLLEKVCDQGRFSKDRVERGLKFWHQVGRVFGLDAYRPKLCTVSFTTRKKHNTWVPEGSLVTRAGTVALDKWEKSRWMRPLFALVIIYQLVRFYGVKPILRRLGHLVKALRGDAATSHRVMFKAMDGCPDLLQISLKSWPDPRLFLGTEKRKCTTLFVSENECARLCERNINAEKHGNHDPRPDAN
jgi:molybdenum cofactor biosynthesis enzyme MoaA